MFINIHDLVRIELLNEPKGIQQVLRSAVGLLEVNSLDADPDITIKFTQHIRLGNRAKFVGTLIAWEEETLYVMIGGKKLCIPIKAFEDSRYELTCEADMAPGPLYTLLHYFFIQHILVKRGATLVHSSAVFFKNKGLLLPAWSDVGKTGIFLKFVQEGAQPMSDDQTIITRDGTILAYPREVDVGRHPTVIPSSLSFFKRKKFLHLDYITWRTVQQMLLVLGAVLGKMPSRILKEAGFQATEKGHGLGPPASVPLATLFPGDELKKSAILDTVFFLTRTNSSEIEINETDGQFLADKIYYTLLCETCAAFLGFYEHLRFAFPDRGGRLIAEGEAKLKEIVSQAFTGKRLYNVSLPSHFDLDHAFDKLVKYV